MNATTTARSRAIAAENDQIEASQGRAIAAREAEQARPRNALEIMARRLDVSPGALKDTLLKTVFKDCNDAEFIAMVAIANEYDLNPITREIYAFPKKGGGIQPIVGYDGWIRIANRHDQFDGYESEHLLDDKGNIVAAEGIVYRKDRSHPTKKMIYLKEFQRQTDPWRSSPSHMLDVRCFCHTIRLGLGVSLGIDGEDNVIDGGQLQPEAIRQPTRQSLAQELGDEIPNYDKKTGEIVDEQEQRDPATGMTDVDEETARELDAQQSGDADQVDEAEAQREAAAETVNAIDGPLEQGDPGPQPEEQGGAADKPAWFDTIESIKARVEAAQNRVELMSANREFEKHMAALPDEVVAEFDALYQARRKALSGKG